MNDTDIFRLVMLITIVIVVPFGVYYRVRSRTDEKLDRWKEGAVILFGLRLSALAVVIGGFAWLINPASMAWSSMPIPDWLRWIGAASVLLGSLLFMWTFQNLGSNLTDTVVTRREHTLVTTGPYRWVRHPFYLAAAIGVFGGCLVAANWFLLLSAIVPCGFLLARTRIEEEKLVERFGDQYTEYMQRVGRFVPKIKI